MFSKIIKKKGKTRLEEKHSAAEVSALEMDNNSTFIPAVETTAHGPTVLKLNTPLLETRTEETSHKLDTLNGVYMPCVMNIIGNILYQRMGWIMGEAGIWVTILMFILGYSVTVTTTLSACAISTNGRIRSGGIYYIISRAIGPLFGASVGAIFITANILGAAFFVIGISEAFIELFPSTHMGAIIAVSILIVTVICFIGTNLYAKTGKLVFGIMMFSLFLTVISFFIRKPGFFEGYTGFSTSTFAANSVPHYDVNPESGKLFSFTSLFPIVFPAVAGMLAGVNICGDLKTPAKSIPYGTISAILTTMIIYIVFLFFMALTISPSYLLEVPNGYFVLKTVCVLPWMYDIALFTTSFSCAIGSVLASAKCLQAIARDDLLPVLTIFKMGTKKSDEPLAATAVVIVIVIIIVSCTQSLNATASYQTLFFLLSYLFVNLACAALSTISTPNFRPMFKFFSWKSAVLGVLLTVGVMFTIDAVNAVICSLILCLLCVLIHFFGANVSWGNVSQSIIFHQVRRYLLQLDAKKSHVKFWRPALLVLCKDPSNAYSQLHFANKLKKGGLYIVGSVISDSFARQSSFGKVVIDTHKTASEAWTAFIDAMPIKAFNNVAIASTFNDGLLQLLMSSGVGAFRPNTVMIGMIDQGKEDEIIDNPELVKILPIFSSFPMHDVDDSNYVECLKTILYFGHHLLISRNMHLLSRYLLEVETVKKGISITPRSIDIWIFPDMDAFTVNLLFVLTYNLYSNKIWQKLSWLRILSVLPEECSAEERTVELHKLIELYRIPCKDVVTLSPKDYEYPDNAGKANIYLSMIQRNSSNTAVCFLPIHEPPESKHDASNYIADLRILTSVSCPVILAHGQSSVSSTDL